MDRFDDSFLQERPVMVNIQSLINDAKCFEAIRVMRWPDALRCPWYNSAEVTKEGGTAQPTACRDLTRYLEPIQIRID